MRPSPRLLGPVALAAVVALGSAGCGIGASSGAAPTVQPSPSASVSPAIAGTASHVRTALGARGLQLSVPQVPFRPAEAPLLVAAPRAVYQVLLPDDPEHGYLVIYEFTDPPAATAAARQQVAYVESGPGRGQFPTDARFVLRQLGATLIFYDWSPSATTDRRAPDVAAALDTVGQGFPIQA
jgi:hypothetical protein